MKNQKIKGIVFASWLTVFTAMAQMDIVSFTAPGPLYNNDPWSLGYSFTVTGSLQVTGLSAFNSSTDPAAGITENTPVDLWNSSGTLLASATVLAGTADPLTTDGFFRYASIAPLTLGPGTYDVAAEFLAGDLYTYSTSGFTSIPGVTFDDDQYGWGATLQFPSDTEGALNGFFGGNVVVGGSDPGGDNLVPDSSSTFMLLSNALLTLVAVRRKLASF
jgi:hypothetical protein